MRQQDFQYIATSLRPKLIGLCQRFFNSQRMVYDCEDAVQETLLRLWQMKDRLKEYKSPESLAVMIAKNVCIDILRRYGHNVSLEIIASQADTSQADEKVIKHDMEQMIEHAMSKLPSTQRRMLMMRSEGMSMAEIAAACNATTNSTKTMICAARKKMMELLKIGRNMK